MNKPIQRSSKDLPPPWLRRATSAIGLALVLSALALSLLLAGCSAPPAREVQSPRDVVNEMRAALVTMTNDDSAKGVALELDRARTFLTEADAAIAKEDDEQKVKLLIELSRGQLVLVKSILERRKAEAALASKSDEYRHARESLETIQHDTKALDPTQEEEPRGDAP